MYYLFLRGLAESGLIIEDMIYLCPKILKLKGPLCVKSASKTARIHDHGLLLEHVPVSDRLILGR